MKVTEPAVGEVMDYRGLSAYIKFSPGTLRQWVMRSEIPYFKIGHSVRFAKKHIDVWLEARHRKPIQELTGKSEDTSGELFPTDEYVARRNEEDDAKHSARTCEGIDEINSTQRTPEESLTEINVEENRND